MSSGGGDIAPKSKGQTLIPVAVAGCVQLSERSFEFRLQRPAAFNFLPGQKITIVHEAVRRDYSLINSVDASELVICFRMIPDGKLSPILAQAQTGDRFHITNPFGFFLYQPWRHPAVFVATGAGVAPFVAFARAGAEKFHLLHGVRSDAELYYRDLFLSTACRYTPCITSPVSCREQSPDAYPGRVTDFLEQVLSPGTYDFYLCGRGEMIRDAFRIIDRRFSGSRVFSESFF